MEIYLQYGFVITVAFVFFLLLQANLKRSKNFGVEKAYSNCYRKVLQHGSDSEAALDSFIAKSQKTYPDYCNKAKLLRLLSQMEQKKIIEKVDDINLEPLFFTDGKFDGMKTARNGESIYWIAVLMIKANKLGKKEVVESLYAKLNVFEESLSKYEEYHLVKAVYLSFSNQEDRGLAIYDKIVTNKKKAFVSDNNVSKVYIDTANAMKQYLGYELNPEEQSALNEFEKTVLGNIVLTNLK